MFCYIGSSGAGQSVTEDSPGYGKVTVTEDKAAIVITKLGGARHIPKKISQRQLTQNSHFSRSCRCC